MTTILYMFYKFIVILYVGGKSKNFYIFRPAKKGIENYLSLRCIFNMRWNFKWHLIFWKVFGVCSFIKSCFDMRKNTFEFELHEINWKFVKQLNFFFPQIQISSLCMCLNISASVELGCLFLPKVYLVIFQPYKNVRPGTNGNQVSCLF